MDDQKLARLISDALFCHHAGEYGRELELWLEVQAAKPGPEWQHNIALALMNNGRYFEALEMFEKLASLNPQLSRVHNNRAALLVRMGLDLQFVVPVLLQGLTNPEDMTELVRHFVNVCGTIALGFDDRQDEAFDLVAKISAEGLERHSPPDLLEKNKDTFLNMLSAYRRTAAYREALAQGKWRTAESELQAAKTKFESVGLDNFARGISSTARYFELCRNTFEMLERLGGGAQLSADEVRDAYKRLLGRASDLRGTEERGAYLARLSDLLGWFLNGAVAALRHRAL